MPPVRDGSILDQRPAGTAPTGWTIGVLLGLGAVLGATLFSTRWATPQDETIVIRTAVGSLAIFFTVVYGISMWKIRSSQRTTRVDLYERLAITPVSRSAVRASMRGVSMLSMLYIAFAAVVTALGLAAIYASNDGEGVLLMVMLGVVIVWAIVALIAIARLLGPHRTQDQMLAPLGLRQVETPFWTPVPWKGGLLVVGEMRFEGERHGRRVTVCHREGESETAVQIAGRTPIAPTSPAEMAALTGERATSYKGVRAETVDDAVIITRSGSAAAAWFLHDLLLAEAVVDSA